MNPKKFLTELKRRNVYRTAVAYAVVGSHRSLGRENSGAKNVLR